ncbi:MAG: hypothetical protein ACM3S0_10790 [Acidobacteriota bacterium]
MTIKSERGKSGGDSFTDWAARIYPTHLFVNKSTHYLQVLHSRMLRVIRRIEDELKRREHVQV